MNPIKRHASKSGPVKRRVFTGSGTFEVAGDLVFDKHLAELPKATRRRFYMSLMVDPMERWLNEQAAQGWAVVGGGPLRFGFEQTPPGEYLVRCEILATPYFTPESQEYLATVAESGAQIVAIEQSVFLVVRRRAALGPFELYSDLDSRIAYTSRIRSWIRQSVKRMALMELLALALILAAETLDWATQSDPGSWWDALRGLLTELAAFAHGAVLWFLCILYGLSAICAIPLGIASAKLTRELNRLSAERAIHE
ncbi:MAG: DUF2812 domain-containing protein [Bifidobacteriaceae bacterium]|nr:DUF2812 domain-containing protein [Bifidobacteriaceae bacterium]